MHTAFNPMGVNFMSDKLFTGAIIFGLLNTAPKGWLLCNGQAISRTDYAELFEVIGTTFGSGDGTSTFNIPNYSGKFLQMDTSKSIGQSIEAGLPNITGTLTDLDGYAPQNIGAGCFKQTNSTKQAGYTGAVQLSRIYSIIDFDASRSSSIYGKSNTVQPPASIVNYFIKY